MVLGAPLFVFLSPPGLVGREIMMVVFFHKLALEGVLVIIVVFLELLTRRFFCRSFCPLGGFLHFSGEKGIYGYIFRWKTASPARSAPRPARWACSRAPAKDCPPIVGIVGNVSMSAGKTRCSFDGGNSVTSSKLGSLSGNSSLRGRCAVFLGSQVVRFRSNLTPLNRFLRFLRPPGPCLLILFVRKVFGESSRLHPIPRGE